MNNTRQRKGIILAGGTGSRLWPVTLGVSKQLLPVHDKPMIYYPLSVLMLTGIKEIAIITTQEDHPQYKRLLGNGKQWGVDFTYLIQERPEGLAQAFIISEDFLSGSPSALVLGDNIFFGHGLPKLLTSANNRLNGATVFGYQVSDPTQYGVLGFDENRTVKNITEKPLNPESNTAITGLYFFDSTATEKAHNVKPSSRGELEITSILEMYLEEKILEVESLGRGFAWLDTGTHESLLDASNFVRTLQKRQGLQVGSPDEIAFQQGWINKEQFKIAVDALSKSQYGDSLASLIN